MAHTSIWIVVSRLRGNAWARYLAGRYLQTTFRLRGRRRWKWLLSAPVAQLLRAVMVSLIFSIMSSTARAHGFGLLVWGGASEIWGETIGWWLNLFLHWGISSTTLITPCLTKAATGARIPGWLILFSVIAFKNMFDFDQQLMFWSNVLLRTLRWIIHETTFIANEKE